MDRMAPSRICTRISEVDDVGGTALRSRAVTYSRDAAFADAHMRSAATSTIGLSKPSRNPLIRLWRYAPVTRKSNIRFRSCL